MDVVFYSMAAIVSAFLFLPRSEGSPIRNVPLLLSLIAIFALLYFIRLIQYIVLMNRTKKHFASKGYKVYGLTFLPAFLFFKGNYSLKMQKGEEKIYISFLVRKNWYLHYHFERADKIEYYKYTRGFFYGGQKKLVAPISKTIDKTKTGGRRVYLPKTGYNKTIIVFNKMPDYVTDSVKKEGLGNGDYICGSNVLLYDVKHLN